MINYECKVENLYRSNSIMEYSKAIVRIPSESYYNCISSHSDHSTLNLEKARKQHRSYITVLEELGLEIIETDQDIKYPDSCFVEDTAILHNQKALITRMGAISRRGEETAIENILKAYFEIEHIENPGIIDGGDVCHVPEKNLLISGLSQRTNEDAINQLSKKLDCNVEIIEDPDIIHLKSYVTYLEDDVFFTTTKYIHQPIFSKYDFQLIEVPSGEEYAANTLTINGNVLIPSGYNQTKQLLSSKGYSVIELNMSEFIKCEGALTCLSLRF